jgi:hypothetical protein
MPRHREHGPFEAEALIEHRHRRARVDARDHRVHRQPERAFGVLFDGEEKHVRQSGCRVDDVLDRAGARHDQ